MPATVGGVRIPERFLSVKSGSMRETGNITRAWYEHSCPPPRVHCPPKTFVSTTRCGRKDDMFRYEKPIATHHVPHIPRDKPSIDAHTQYRPTLPHIRPGTHATA